MDEVPVRADLGDENPRRAGLPADDLGSSRPSASATASGSARPVPADASGLGPEVTVSDDSASHTTVPVSVTAATPGAFSPAANSTLNSLRLALSSQSCFMAVLLFAARRGSWKTPVLSTSS